MTCSPLLVYGLFEFRIVHVPAASLEVSHRMAGSKVSSRIGFDYISTPKGM